MSIFKRLFKKNTTKENSDFAMISKIQKDKYRILDDVLPVADCYYYSNKFVKDNDDPYKYESERLKNLPVDPLMSEKRIPAIKADTQLEVEVARKQYIEHLSSLSNNEDLCRSLIIRITDLLDRVNEEIAEYDAELEKLKEKVKERDSND